MLNIKKTVENQKAEFALEGRLDTLTAPELETEINGLNEIKELILDMQNLEYVSSAGLRVLLIAQKIMNKQGAMVVKNVNETVGEIFEVTGFSDIFTIE